MSNEEKTRQRAENGSYAELEWIDLSFLSDRLGEKTNLTLCRPVGKHKLGDKFKISIDTVDQ